jgi:hypothetical protein
MRTSKHHARAIVSYVVIGFFAGTSATYLFEHGLHGSLAALLGIAGILAGVAVGAGFNWQKLDRARRARIISNVSQARTRWDYRPRQLMQRDATLDSEGTETLGARSRAGSDGTVDHDVWFDFGSADPSAEDVFDECP